MADRPGLDAVVAPLAGALAAIAATFREAGVPGMVIGGVAASLLGRPRATRDVDAVAWAPGIDGAALLAAAAASGLQPRIDDPLAFAKTSGVLLLRHAATGIDVDVALASLPFERDAIARARPTTVGGVTVPLVTPEDLVILKAVAGRPRDLVDIEAVLAATPKLDRRRVRRWVRAFADALEMPEVASAVERLLRPPRRR